MDEFHRLVAAIDYPLFIVTTTGSDGEHSGCVVGFATQCSIDPPRFLVALSEKNHTFGTARTATHLAVHVLDRREKRLADLFGGETGDEVDKFASCNWNEGPHGMPILDDIEAWFVGRILDRIDLGDHLGHVLDPVEAKAAPRDNLQFGEARDIEAGHPADE
ncbi:MAG TPA: flavin reductase family protein [Acidimicrobiales bacterium]|nr:flavin reductase family protein [Acidimicrobiales bacterium]